MKRVIWLIALVALFTACAQIEDMQDRSQVRIQMGNVQGEGRFLASNGTKVIVAFLEDSDVYLFEEYDTVATTIEMNGIITGDYILLVLLLEEDDDVVGLATKAVSIDGGINYIDVTLGPGIWDLFLNSEDLDLTDLPSGYGLTVGENSLSFDIPDTEFNTSGSGPEFTVKFRTNAVETPFVIAENPSGSGSVGVIKDVQTDYMGVTVEARDGARSFTIEMTDPQYAETFTYTISFN